MESENPASESGFLISYPVWVPGVTPGDGPGSEVPILEIPDLGSAVCIFMAEPEAHRYLEANLSECSVDQVMQFQTPADFLHWMRSLPSPVGFLAFPTLDDQGVLDSASFVSIADYISDLEMGKV